MTAKTSLWTKPYTLAVLANFFVGVPYALFLPVLPIYIIKELHGSSLAAGAVNAVFLLGMVLFRAQTDRIEQRFGKRPVLFVASLLFACSNLAYLAAGSILTILFIRFFSGIFFAVANTSLMSLGSQLIPLNRKGEGLAYLTTAITVGTALGPFVGLSLSKSYGFDTVFVFSLVIALVGTFMIHQIDIPRRVRTVRVSPRRLTFHDLFEVRAIPASSIIFLLMISISAVLTFVSVYASGLQLYAASTYFFVVLALCSVASRLLTSRISDRFGANYVMYPAVICLALGFFVLGQATTSFSMFCAAALVGFAYGIFTPAMQMVALQHSPQNRVNVVTATYFTFLDLGMAAGSYLVGVCIPLVGFATLYSLLCPFALSVALLYYWVCGRNREMPGLVCLPEQEFTEKH